VGWNPITDYLASSLVTRFNSLYPGITISTLEMPQHQIESALLEDRIDVGIAFSRVPTDSSTAGSREIETQVLFEETLCLAIGYEHPRAGQQEPITTEALARESLAMLNEEFALRRHINEYCRTQGISPRIAIETDSLSVLIELVKTGATLATVLPVTIVYDQCGMHAIPITPEIPRKAISIIYRRSGYTSPASRAFKALAHEWAVRRLEEVPNQRKGFCPLMKENRRESSSREKAQLS
jgi:LysR family cyn operon transcriptional activator